MLFRKSIGYSPQEVANGTAPAGYTPRRTVPATQQPAAAQQPTAAQPTAAQPTQTFSSLTTATSTLPTENPIATQMATIQTQAAASAQPITQTLQPVAPPVVVQPDPTPQLEKELEKSIEAYCQIQLSKKKAEGFDPTCVDELWELLQRVQQSLDDGVYSSELVGRQIASLTSRIRQCRAFYERYRDKKRLLPSSSNLLEELRSAEKRFMLLEAEIRKFNNAFDSFERESKASARTRSTSHSPPSALEPISTEDQNQINLVNGEISRRVARYARKVAFIQQRVQLIKAHADRQSLYVEKEEASDTKEKKSEDTKEKNAEDANQVAEDLHRFLLIIDSQDANESVQRNTSRSSDTVVKKHSVNERQLALKRLMEQHAQSPRAVLTVCPKKLIVDESLNASEKTPRRQRTTAAEDLGISRQLMAAKNSPILSNRSTSVATPPRLSGSLTLGTPVSPIAMISAAKSATGPTAPKPTTFTFMPHTQTNVSTTTATTDSVPFSFAPKPSTIQSETFGNAFGTNTATGSAVSDEGMEDDTTSAESSSFSFAGTGLGSTTAANRTGGGFGSLNWGAMSQRPAAPAFGSFGNGAAAQAPQSPQTGSAFGSAAAFGSGPSFGSGSTFGGNSAFGSTAFKSPFGNASSAPQASPSSGGFSA
ncbi:hypothetical protein M3Y98_00455400 [Aphelenchoides besseyi]|nr:hypothetical protein M3Y98_00455400 [Aphelenchoides besseyi]